MRHIYYINGKSVNAETYWNAVDAQDWQDFLHKSCIKYYKKYPDKFKTISIFSDEKTLYLNMLTAYIETDDWKKAKALHERNNKRLQLVCLIFMIMIFIIPIILLILEA